MKLNIRKIIFGLVLSCCSVLFLSQKISFAAEQFTVLPEKQSISLSPGEKYIGAFIITNPETSSSNFDYDLVVSSDVATDKQPEGFQDFSKWISFDEASGTVIPYSSKEILFTVNVPEGIVPSEQFVSVKVVPKNKDAFTPAETGDIHRIHIVITNELLSGGKITSASVPSFLVSGKISGRSVIENGKDGQSNASYTLEVYPIFSNEAVYSNSGSPETKEILPGKTEEHEIVWEETPSVGMYNVVYAVRVGDQMKEVKKLVILFPIWLIILVLAIAVGVVVFILYQRKRKNTHDTVFMGSTETNENER